MLRAITPEYPSPDDSSTHFLISSRTKIQENLAKWPVMVFRLPSLHPAGWAGILLFGILGASLPQQFPFGDGTLLETLWIIGAVVATIVFVAGCLRTPVLELRHIPTAFGIPGIIAWAFLSAGIENAAQSTSILETIASSLPL